MHEDKKIDINEYKVQLIDTIHFQVSPLALSYKSNNKTILLQVSVVNSASGSFCWTMQLTLSSYGSYADTNICCNYAGFILRFYCNYVGGTFSFCYTYVGESFCCSYEDDSCFLYVSCMLQLCS